MGPPARLCVLYQHKENGSERGFLGPGVSMRRSLRALPFSLADPGSRTPRWNYFHLSAVQGHEVLDVPQMHVTLLNLSV